MCQDIPDDLMNDDDEEIMAAEATAQGRIPVSAVNSVSSPPTYSYTGWP